MNYDRHITLRQAFGIERKEVIALVGGGGKTTLMFALARELYSNDDLVITTTTTKILEPLPSETPLLLLETDETEIVRLLLQNIGTYRHITLARERLTSGKLAGISTELVAKLNELKQVAYIIIEADGAAHKPLKAPNLTEPVIPDNTSLVIPVVGADALGCTLDKENVFRLEIVSRLLDIAPGEIITDESIATLVTHPQGIAKGSPDHARIVPFINKVDLHQDRLKVRNLATKILAKGHHQIEAVVLGQARFPELALEVINKSRTI